VEVLAMRRALFAPALLVAAVVLASAGAEKKGPSVKDIMTKAHKGGDSLLGRLELDLGRDAPDWPADRERTKELVGLGTALGKHLPPQGARKSWVAWTNRYLVAAKALDAAVEQKSLKSSRDALDQLKGTCSGCHRDHRDLKKGPPAAGRP
jgi:hypothetical protein